MKKLFLLLVAMIMNGAVTFSQELPDSWSICYMNSGALEYCNTSFNASGYDISITLFKDALLVEFESNNFGRQATMDFGGIKVDGECSSYGEWSFKIPYDKLTDEIIDRISKGVARITFSGTKTFTAMFTGPAAKDFKTAIEWAKENSFES